MRIILKIIAAPFVLALILAVAVLSFLSCIAGRALLAGVYRFSFCWRPAVFSQGCIPGVLPCWCWRFWFPPLGSRPSGSGCWSACMG